MGGLSYWHFYEFYTDSTLGVCYKIKAITRLLENINQNG